MKNRSLLQLTVVIVTVLSLTLLWRSRLPGRHASDETNTKPTVRATDPILDSVQAIGDARRMMPHDEEGATVKPPEPSILEETADFKRMASSEQQSLWSAFSEARRKIRPLTEHQRTLPENAGADYLASNPSQRIRARFLPDRVRVLSSYAGRDWQLELGLADARVGEIRQSGARLEYDHGVVTEWYHNRPEGFEHGFVIHQKTAELTASKSGQLRLSLYTRGLTAQPLQGRQPGSSDLQLVTASGEPVLSYEKLKVWDADGVVLPAEMRATQEGMEILVADAGARYPLVVDPLIASLEQKLGLVADEGARYDRFGASVSVSGDTALIGAYNDSDNGSTRGSAYVFVRSSGVWTEQQKLTAINPIYQDRNFGYSVSVDGDTALVGAYLNGSVDTGSAHVFVRIGTTWNEQQRLTASDPVFSSRFGLTVSVDGDTALVGAYRDNDNGTNSGSVYVYVRSNGAWTEQFKLKPDDGLAEDNFGISVSLSGDTALVGATQRYSSTRNGRGNAYVFVRSGTTWSQQQKITAGDAADDDLFGSSVSLSGDTAVIGAPRDYFTTPANSRGKAYVFVRSGTAWSEQQQLSIGDAEDGDLLGTAVSASGDTAVIGAPGPSSAIGFGKAYVFVRSGTTWSEEQKITASDGETGENFGNSVCVDGDTVLVGAPSDDDKGNNSGSAYVFVRSGTTWSEEQKLREGAAGDRFGYSVSLSGDTALIGANADDDNGSDSGAAYVFVRSGTTWSEQQKLLPYDGATNDEFGCSVSVSGDTALIGAWGHDDGGDDAGAAYVFLRSGATWTYQGKLEASDAAVNDSFGWSVSIDGDSALIGAWGDYDGGFRKGAAYVFTRSGTTWSEQAKLVALDGVPADYFGWSVSIDGDSALIGAWGDDDSGDNTGAAYVFTRSGAVWSEQSKLTATDGAALDYFGWSVSIDGDTALIGAYSDDVEGATTGSAYIFTRSGVSWSEEAKLIADDGEGGEHFGSSVSLSGDTALVGAHYDDLGAVTAAGSAYVFSRVGTFWPQQGKITAGDAADYDKFGYSVSLDGDTALIGAYQDEGAPELASLGIDYGSVYVYRFDIDLSSPEIDVEEVGAGPVPSDGALSPFGSVEIGTTSSAKTIRIRNFGGVDLSMPSIEFISGDEDDFNLDTSGTQSVIPSGGETSFTVSFAPEAAGARYATIRILSNDPDEAVYDIDVTGTGFGFPEIAISGPGGPELVSGGSGLNFGNVAVDAIKTLLVTITNTGTADLTGISVSSPSAPPGSDEPFINEVQYKGGGIDDFVEVVAPAGYPTSGWQLHFYTPFGSRYRQQGLGSSTIPDEGNGYGAVYLGGFNIADNGGGVALVHSGPGEVKEFISWQGTVVATDGPAAGMESTDIGVFQEGFDGRSLQKTGTGTYRDDFTWTGPETSSPGWINSGQTFVPAPPPVFTVNTSQLASVLPRNESTYFEVSFLSSNLGPASAQIQVNSNDADENPFVIPLSANAEDAAVLRNAAFTDAGLSGADADPSATPFDDGVENLLKYAFNMNLSGADSSKMVPGGTSGEPGGELVEVDGQTYWRVEYVVRKGSGLVYAPKKTSDLSQAFVDMTATPRVEPIDGDWDRLIIDEPCDPEVEEQCFSHVEVTLP